MPILLLAQAVGGSQPTLFLGFLPATPPSWLVYLTVLFASSTFLFRLVKFGWERLDRKRDRLIAIEDDYWFRDVVLPTCIEPLIKLVVDESAKYKALESRSTGSNTMTEAEVQKSYQDFLSAFMRTKNEGVHRLRLLTVIDVGLYDLSAKALDDLEDRVTTACARRSMPNAQQQGMDRPQDPLFFDALTDVVTQLRKYQRSLHK